MNEQRMKIEMEALRFFFKHKGEDIPDEVLKALVTWPENTEINKAVKTIIDVLIALEIATAMKKILQEVYMVPKFPSGGIISGRGPENEFLLPGERIIPRCELIKPFPWADAPTVSFIPDEERKEGHKIKYETQCQIDKIRNLSIAPAFLYQPNDKGGGTFTGILKFKNIDDHGKEDIEEDISLQNEEEKRVDGPGHICDMDKPPE
jgi:hypothetical protein